ncbi:MAG: hypothetical protein B6244_07985 [Candidatus Cloacimonetes bacterium 4572_55]|nr:MAG: hypothetical protein B6244_07985 [Candidatus Cloacimonetes bacterium 4572_55]
MKEMIELLAKNLAKFPEKVEVIETLEEPPTSYKYTLKVSPDDLGRVIGRGGQTAEAIRALMAATAAKAGIKAVLEIRE